MSEMDISSQSNGGFSDQQAKENYIKKNIVPVRRGKSAIFGDPVSQQNGLDFPSPATSQRNSRVSGDKEKREKELRQEEVEHEKKEEEDERVNNGNEEQVIENGQESLNDSPIIIEQVKQAQRNPAKQESPRQNALRDNRVNQNPPPRQITSNQFNQQQRPENPIQHEQPYYSGSSQRLSQPRQSQQNIRQSQQLQPHQSFHQVGLYAGEIQVPIILQHFTDSNISKLKLKHKKYHFIEQASDQSKLILQVLQKNMHHLQTIEERISSQSVILNQFKEETSRKLEENVKLALKEKMNEINRENSKEIKDIKNLCLNLQQLFLQNSKRMESMQKKLETLQANLTKIQK